MVIPCQYCIKHLESIKKVLMLIKDEGILEYFIDDDELRELVRQMLVFDSNIRPSSQELLSKIDYERVIG